MMVLARSTVPGDTGPLGQPVNSGRVGPGSGGMDLEVTDIIILMDMIILLMLMISLSFPTNSLVY